MNPLKSLAVAAVLAVSTIAAQASTVVLDTLGADATAFNFSSNPDGLRLFNLGVSFGGNTVPYGQSFTLDRETTNLSVAAYFGSFSGDAVVSARLHAGAGFSSEIASTGAQTITGPSRDGVLGSFDFSSFGALSAGVYTVFFSGSGALGGGTVNVTAPNTFVGVDTTGTEAYARSGLFNFGTNPARDFGIRVTGDVAPVPLPAGLPMLLAGLGAFALVRRRLA